MFESRARKSLIFSSMLQVLYNRKTMSETRKEREGRERTGSFGSDTLKDIVHKRVEDGHCLVGDTRIWVDLLQHYTRSQSEYKHLYKKVIPNERTFINIRRISLLSGLLPLLLLPIGSRRLGRLLRCFLALCRFGRGFGGSGWVWGFGSCRGWFGGHRCLVYV